MSSRRFYLACATIAAAAIGSIAWAEYAEAQQAPPKARVCGPTAKLVADLQKIYGETWTESGLVSEQIANVLFTSPGGATWTSVLIGVDGEACVIAAGIDWYQAPPERKPLPGERAA